MTQSFHPDPGLDPNTMDIFATQLVRVFSSRQGDNTTDTVPLAPGCWIPGTLWHWRTPDHVSSVTTTLHSMSSFRNTFGPNGGGHIKNTHNYILKLSLGYYEFSESARKFYFSTTSELVSVSREIQFDESYAVRAEWAGCCGPHCYSMPQYGYMLMLNTQHICRPAAESEY